LFVAFFRRKPASTLLENALDHDDFGSDQSNRIACAIEREPFISGSTTHLVPITGIAVPVM
jgi:hypothetical protein